MTLTLDRRTAILATASAVALTASGVDIHSTAHAQATRIRPSASSPEGQNALLLFREGVKKMRQWSRDDFVDTRGWTYQALIHGILDRSSKPTFMRRFFGNTPETDSVRRAAEASWATCPHGRIQFLPWHRIYVHFLERIVREACGDSSFMLPYWDYTQGGEDARIPLALREAVDGSPLNNPLFNTARDPRMNGLFGPADRLPQSDISLDALKQPEFAASETAAGLSAALENTPHGVVHTDVGGSDEIGFPVGDMSSVATAGRDPVFWLHHANIDRLWESWLRAGGETTQTYKTEAWYNQNWTFFDENGNRQNWSLADFDEATKDSPIGYDRLETIARDEPVEPPLIASNRFSVQSETGFVLEQKGNLVVLESGSLTAAPPPPASAITSARIVIADLSAETELAVNFDVFLNLAEGSQHNEANRIGVISFFGVAMAEMVHKQTRILEVTDHVRRAIADGLWPAKPTITIVPRGGFAGQRASVGSVQLIIER